MKLEKYLNDYVCSMVYGGTMGIFFSKSEKEPLEKDKLKELRTKMLLDAIKNRETNNDNDTENKTTN